MGCGDLLEEREVEAGGGEMEGVDGKDGGSEGGVGHGVIDEDVVCFEIWGDAERDCGGEGRKAPCGCGKG